jgi:hypothetical protein
MPSLRGRIARATLTYEEELLAVLRDADVVVLTELAPVTYEHVAVYIEDDQANLDRARAALDAADYGYVSAYTYDKLTLIVR